MDLVVNHSSDEHEWFKEIRNQKIINIVIITYGEIQKLEKMVKMPPNNWISFFGGSAWEYSEDRDQYYLHLFTKKQPDLNWENEEVRKEVHEIMKFTLDKGIDGFRMDVINLISKVQGLPDGKEEHMD